MSLLLLFLSVASPTTAPAGAKVRIRNDWRHAMERIQPDSEFGTKRGKGRAVELLEEERQEAAKAAAVKPVAKIAKPKPVKRLVAPSIEAEAKEATAAADAKAQLDAQAQARIDAKDKARAEAEAAELQAQIEAQAAIDEVHAQIEAERQRLLAIAMMDDLDILAIG